MAGVDYGHRRHREQADLAMCLTPPALAASFAEWRDAVSERVSRAKAAPRLLSTIVGGRHC
jgi:hypothetical protein